MSKSGFLSFCLISLIVFLSCQGQSKKVLPGAYQINDYLNQLKDKNVALLVNQTSVVNGTHLLDTLLSFEIDIKKVFAPEHGFRGNKSNGALIKDTIDQSTGIPIISLYGNNKKPSTDQLNGIDVIVYDIQDVGARFYTYISSMHYMMEACAENGIQFVLLDRPNPNGDYVDGPILKNSFSSFVGMHPIPIVYGMTPGEVAQMIIGEEWLETTEELDFMVYKTTGWTHSDPYKISIAPSPNLPNDQSIALYPSLCLFEGTNVSVGRGTEFPFQVIGYPDQKFGSFSFTPISIPGVSKYPKHENKVCYGEDLRSTVPRRALDLSYLIQMYNLSSQKDEFFSSFFDKLAGTDQLRIQIEEGMTESEIKETWKNDLNEFRQIRNKYLLYLD